MKRREFLNTVTLATGAILSTGCTQKNDDKKSININKNRKVRLKLATSWPAHFPIMGTAVDTFVEQVKIASGGSLEIKIYPKNTLVPALAVFDTTSTGQIDAFHSGPYYWKGKNSAFSLFSGIPFGLTAEEINSWMKFGGGYELWRELYAKYNLYPLMGGNTNLQMGGWFKKPINSLSDLEGLKMRIPGLGGEVFAKMGVNPILLPAGEIYTALDRGVIDATEWVGPALDLKMGFDKIAPYYYKGWHEPGSILELTFNKHKWNSLSKEHQTILTLGADAMNANMTYEFHAKNMEAFAKIDRSKVTLKEFPKDVQARAKEELENVIKEESIKNPDFKRVIDSMQPFLEKSKIWTKVGLNSYLNIRDL